MLRHRETSLLFASIFELMVATRKARPTFADQPCFDIRVERCCQRSRLPTEPNDLMATLHNRMPVILGADDHDRRLDLDADPAEVSKTCPTDWLESYPVDKRVGKSPQQRCGA